jgi:hypothetical protein
MPAEGAGGGLVLRNEAFARVKIDQLLKDAEWALTDGVSVRYEYPLDDGGRADQLVAVIEDEIKAHSEPSHA